MLTGISTLTGDVNFVGSLDNVNVTGAALTTINVKAIGGNYTGVVTASLSLVLVQVLLHLMQLI